MSEQQLGRDETDAPSLSVAARAKSKYEQAFRLYALYYGSRRVPFYLVTEYPKSGGTWLGQLIAGCSGLPFPRNKVPRLEPSVLHGHYLPNARLRSLRSIFWLVRDGRDVMVSLYHHRLVWNERTRQHPKEVLYYRQLLPFDDYEDVQTNLPAFLEHAFTHVPSKLRQYTFPGTWASFNGAWDRQTAVPADSVVRVRYEDLLDDTTATLTGAIQPVFGEIDPGRVAKVVDALSFSAQTGRNAGEEDRASFLRKGVAGDWINYFTGDAARVFDHYAGEELVSLGYEPDHSWVEQVG